MDLLPRLGVNIDHVATLRNARGEDYPSPLRAALLCQDCGADGITAHLREDRRHIRDKDIQEIINNISIPLNFEIAPTEEMLNIALKYKPNFDAYFTRGMNCWGWATWYDRWKKFEKNPFKFIKK